MLEDLFSEFFILQKAKDIVSGDFFYADRKDGVKYFSVIDCTGHGNMQHKARRKQNVLLRCKNACHSGKERGG
jgi:hypothetical protein